jgi:hypothetical protein
MIVEKGVPHKNIPPPRRLNDTHDGVPDSKAASGANGKANKGIGKRRSAGLLEEEGGAEDDDDEDDI